MHLKSLSARAGQSRPSVSSTSPSTAAAPKVFVTPPDKASAAVPVVPTDSLAHPLSIGDYELRKLDQMEEGAREFSKRAEVKLWGDPKANHAALLQAKTEGRGFYERGPHHLETQGKAEAAATLASGKYENVHQGRFGTTETKAEFAVGTRMVGEAAGKLSGTDGALVGHAKVEALAGASGEFKVEQKHGKHLSESLEGSVVAGARGLAVATAAFDRKERTAMAKVGFFALAGAREAVHGEVKVGALRLSAGAAAIQGVHAVAFFGAGVKDGRLMVTADLGGALGVGATVRVGASLNGRALSNAARATGHQVKVGARAAGHKTREGAHAFKQHAHSAGHRAQEKAQAVGHSMKEGLSSLRPSREPPAPVRRSEPLSYE